MRAMPSRLPPLDMPLQGLHITRCTFVSAHAKRKPYCYTRTFRKSHAPEAMPRDGGDGMRATEITFLQDRMFADCRRAHLDVDCLFGGHVASSEVPHIVRHSYKKDP